MHPISISRNRYAEVKFWLTRCALEELNHFSNQIEGVCAGLPFAAAAAGLNLSLIRCTRT
jgi:hypothetical protein